MDYIEKLNLQTEEIEEVENLEKHTIINTEPFSVNKYNGLEGEFLALDGEYSDGFKQLKEVDGLGISCIVSKEVKEARTDVNGNVHEKLKDRIDSEVECLNASLDNKVNKTEQESEMVSRRVRGQNNVDSPSGTFDFANFARQGKETGIASTPIGGVIHHYTDGKVVQIDNVGENNVILTMVNANNPTRRPDKDPTFYGKGYFLQLFTNNQNKKDDVNTGGIYDHLTIDEKGMFFWSGYTPSGVKNNPTTFTTGKNYDYYPGFVFNAVKEHEDIMQLKTNGNTILSLKYNKTSLGSEIYSPTDMNGMDIKTGKGDIRLQPVSGNNVRISNNAYINKQDGRGSKEVSVIDYGSTSERPTTNLQCGMMFFDRTLNKPIWRNKDNNGWVDAMGTSV